MVVTEVIPINSKRSKVFLDGEYAFILYKGELRQYGVCAGSVLTEETYTEIMQDVLEKRGRARALNLLLAMDRTECQLRQKLQEGGYPEEIINHVLTYVKEYHYVDDARYAGEFIRTRSHSKSRRQMQVQLQMKGVSTQVIQQAFEEQGEMDESEAICRFIEKKHIDLENADRNEIYKLFSSLIRKGFGYEQVRRELRLKNADL